jgi:hypothetical protein
MRFLQGRLQYQPWNPFQGQALLWTDTDENQRWVVKSRPANRKPMNAIFSSYILAESEGALRRLNLLLFVGMLACPFAWGQDPAPSVGDAAPSTEKCTVAGVVLRKGSNEPIHFARVTLESEGDTPVKLHAVTGVDGAFTVKDVPPGEYMLSVARNGYVNEVYGARHPMDPGVPLTLAPGKRMEDLIFRITPAGVIVGHVRDENGEALPGAQVTALLSRFADGKRTLIPAGAGTVNDLGEYRLFNLPPGRYLLSAAYEPNSRMGAMFIGAMGVHEEREGLVTTYYPGTTDPAQAAAVNVDPGVEVRSLDFSLQPSGTFHVRGRVLGANSKDSRIGGGVMLRKGNGRLTALTAEKSAAINEKDGTFDIEEVAPGSYEAIAFEFTGDTQRITHRSVEVSGADVDGVELVFEPTVTVAGHLRWDANSTPANVPLQILLEPDDQLFGARPSADVLPDGSFELKNVGVDTYSVNITGPAPDAYLKAARYGSDDALTSFRPGSGAGSTLELTVSSHGAHIEGVVMNADPVPVQGVWVTLIPDDANRKQKRLFQSMRSRPNGKFEFRGVAPGDYQLFSWDNIEEHEWDDPEFLKPFKTKGVAISVAEGDAKSVDLTVIQTKSEEEAKQ